MSSLPPCLPLPLRAKADSACALQMAYGDMLALMQRSTFCLMPPGETASSRRLTDAVLSGCIPVFIGPPWHEMPLPDYVEYTAFAVFIVAQQPR